MQERHGTLSKQLNGRALAYNRHARTPIALARRISPGRQRDPSTIAARIRHVQEQARLDAGQIAGGGRKKVSRCRNLACTAWKILTGTSEFVYDEANRVAASQAP